MSWLLWHDAKIVIKSPHFCQFSQSLLVDNHAYEELHLNGLRSVEYYARLYAGQNINKVDRIQSVLEPKHIIAWFKSIGIMEYDLLLERIAFLYEPKNATKRGFLLTRFTYICL
jgi:hypothetical protein